MSREDLIAILESIDELQTELYRANLRRDAYEIADISHRLTNLMRCLDIARVIDALKDKAA